jgi:hypothetical protein
MDCPKAQEWLLQSDLAEAAPADVAAHLAACQACRQMAERLRRLEQSVRDLPPAAGEEAARKAFLKNLRFKAASPTRRRAAGPSRRRLLAWVAAAAAVVMLACGLTMFLPGSGGPQTAEAATVLDDLVDWNIELADTDSLADRQQLYAAHAGELEQMARECTFSPDAHELADCLLRASASLARQNDPLQEAAVFTDVAAALVHHIRTATAQSDARSVQHLSHCYGRVAQCGINASVGKIKPGACATAECDRQLQKIQHRHTELRDQLKALLAKSPEASSQEIRRALDASAPRHHAKT